MSATGRHQTLPMSLTQTIRALSVPVRPDLDDMGAAAQPKVLVFCRDRKSRKWAPRWLAQEDVEVTLAVEGVDGLSMARETRPDVIVVEGAILTSDVVPLYQALLDSKDLDMPIFVLCGTSRELLNAREADAFDIARKPYQWEIIAPRIKRAAQLKGLGEKLAEREESLTKALELADAARQRLRSRESFEPVTGLPNKGKFKDLLRRGMSAVDRDGNRLAVIVIGFNRFRLVVEAMGQDHADLVMADVGESICRCIRETDPEDAESPGVHSAAAASIDQFRFAIMLSYSGNDAELLALKQRLIQHLSQPIHIAGQTIYLSACLGISMYPGDAGDPDSLLQRADNAMRDAQSRGGGFKYYCTETDAAAARMLRLEHMLHEALDRHELEVAYQPINRVASGAMVAVEALLRWPQPDGSMIPPDEFVPIAEESGLMVRAGDYVLNEACRSLVRWRKEGYAIDYIAVNVSRVQLAGSDFVERVRTFLSTHGLQPSSLLLELSERGVLSRDNGFLEQMRLLRDLGVRIAVDDFGTGDSAIAYLKDMPVDVLKIDRSFISGINRDGKEAAIASAMVALGQRLGLTVVAEGVETEAQLETLKRLGCDNFQGFLVSKPRLGDEVLELLSNPGQTPA